MDGEFAIAEQVEAKSADGSTPPLKENSFQSAAVDRHS
jgi:hypothetical protein